MTTKRIKKNYQLNYTELTMKRKELNISLDDFFKWTSISRQLWHCYESWKVSSITLNKLADILKLCDKYWIKKDLVINK